MKKVLILHGRNCHYSIIGSFFEQFQDYSIDILFPQEVVAHPNLCERFDGWSQMYDNMNLKYNIIDKITTQKYDFCVLDTDWDDIGCSYYHRYFNGTPILVVTHDNGRTRDSIDPKYKRQLWVLGSHNPSSDYYFFGCHFLNIDEKMRLLTPKISVVIIGRGCGEMSNSPSSLEHRVSNFKDIDFLIINRELPPTCNHNYSNIKYSPNCGTLQMNYIVSQSHYVWFYSSDHKMCTGSIHMAYTMLCRCILHHNSQDQYGGIQTPIFGGDDSRFTLTPLTRHEVTAVSNERDYLCNQSKQAIQRRLIGDPIICQN